MATDVIQNNTPSTNQQNGVITSDQLKPSPTLNLPDAPKYTYGGIPGATEALVTQAKTDQQNQLDLQKQGVDNSLKQYMDELVNSGNISSSVDRTAQNTAKEKYNYYTSLLEQENLANRRAIEAIQSRGGLASQVDAEVADVNRKSLSKQADIAILQTAANRDYETASAIADRQVALNLEKSNAKLSALKYFYEQNKYDFTTQEQRAYEQKIKEDERAYNKEEQRLNDIKSLKLTLAKNGAGPAVLSSLDSAKDINEAINNPQISQYFNSPAEKLDLQIKRLQLTKAKNEAAGGDGLLSIDEAQKLGVPYGTTRKQAIALQGKSTQNEAQIKAFSAAQNLLNKVNDDLKTGLLPQIPVGSAKIGLTLPGSKRADFIAAEKNLISLITLDNLKYLKGTMSDNDVRFITSASTSLNRNQSIPEYKKTLEDIVNTLAKYSPEYQYASAGASLANTNQNDPYQEQLSKLNQ